MGWGLVPDSSPYENDFGVVFSENLKLKKKLKFKHFYKVGYWHTTEKGKFEYKTMSTGLSWQECFDKLDNGGL